MRSLWLILSFVSLLYPQIWSLPKKVDPPGSSPTSVVPVIDKFGRIVCFYGHWMFYLDTLTEKWSEPESIPGTIWLFLAGRLEDGDLWIFTTQKSFFYYDYNKWSEPIPPASKYCIGYAVGDSANRLWMSWRDIGPDNELWVITSYYDGWRWVDPYYVSQTNGFPTHMTVDRLGRVWVSWEYFSSAYPKFSFFTRYFNGNRWSHPLLVKEGLIQPGFLWELLILQEISGLQL